MVAHALPRKAALYIETAFVTGGPADWSDNGTYFYLTNVDTSGVVQQTVANENNVTRPRFKHDMIHTLRNSSFSFGTYVHSNPTKAAEAAAATTYHIAELLYAALGGRDLGYGIGIADAGADTDEIEVDSDPGYAQGDWIYCYDASSEVGEFYRIESIDAGPPVVLTLDRPLHFTPDAGGADRAYAVIDCFINAYATTQHDNADHKTMQFLVQGDLSDDVQIMKGCKPALGIEAITAGTPMQFNFDVQVTTFEGADEATQDDFGAATPVGEAPLVPGIGTTTKVKMADFGSPLATVAARGSITVTPGVGYNPVNGPNGTEGVHGYVDTLDDTTVEMMVDFDSDYIAEFRAKTKKHVLIQVGDALDSVGIYIAKAEYMSEPLRNDEGGLTGSTLTMRALENSASAGALTGTNLEKWRSGLHILLVA